MASRSSPRCEALRARRRSSRASGSAISRPREPGDELYANYLTEGYTPFEWFMNLGYVPPEALAQN